MKEKHIEAKVVRWCKANGVYTRKFSSPAHRGVPDRIFAKGGLIIFVEFKDTGKKPTPLQYKELEDLWVGAGIDSAWTNDADECISNLKLFFVGLRPWEDPAHPGWHAP